MNEAKEVERGRTKIVKRRNSRAVEIAVWLLVIIEAWPIVAPLIEGLL